MDNYFEKNNKKEKYPQPNLLGEHQIINAGIALKAFNLIMKKKFNKNFVKKGLKTGVGYYLYRLNICESQDTAVS